MKNTLRLIVIAIAIFVIVACLNSATTVSGFAAAPCDKVIKDAMGRLNTRLADTIKILYNREPVSIHKNSIIEALDQIKLYLTTSNNSISLSDNSCRRQFNAGVSKINLGTNIATIKAVVNGSLPLNATDKATYKVNVKTVKNRLGVDKDNKFVFKF